MSTLYDGSGNEISVGGDSGLFDVDPIILKPKSAARATKYIPFPGDGLYALNPWPKESSATGRVFLTFKLYDSEKTQLFTNMKIGYYVYRVDGRNVYCDYLYGIDYYKEGQFWPSTLVATLVADPAFISYETGGDVAGEADNTFLSYSHVSTTSISAHLQLVRYISDKHTGFLDQVRDYTVSQDILSLGRTDEMARRFRTEVIRENNRTKHAFRIGSFNIARYGQAHWYKLKECLQNYGLDICGLQEVTYPLGDDSAVSNPYTKKLSEEFLSWQFNSFSTNGASGDFPNSTSHDYATNVRSMMAGNGFEVDTSVEYQFQSQGGSSWDWRYVEKCELSIPRYKDKRGSENLKLSIYNTQLELSKSYNLAQAQEILNMVANDPNPFIIIMGDTNDFTLGKETWALFDEAGFTPVINTNTSTVSGTEDFNCIDNFFVSSRIHALDWNVVWAQDWPWVRPTGSVVDQLSDHDLVYADLQLDYSDIRCVNLFLTNCTTTWTRGWLSDSETVTITITPDTGYQLPAQPNKMLDCMIANPEALSYSNGTITIDGSKLIGDVFIKIVATEIT